MNGEDTDNSEDSQTEIADIETAGKDSSSKENIKPASTQNFEQQSLISHLLWGTLTRVDSNGPVQPLFKLRNSKWCSVSRQNSQATSKGSDQTEALLVDRGCRKIQYLLKDSSATRHI